MGRREGGGSPHPPTHPALPVPGAPAPIFGAQGPRGIAGFPVSPVGYKEPCCACHTLRHSETPCEGSQKAWGGITPPPPGPDSFPHAAELLWQLQDSFCLAVGGEGGDPVVGDTDALASRDAGQKAKEGGTAPGLRPAAPGKELQRANSSPKDNFCSRRSGVSSRPSPGKCHCGD